MEPSEISSVTVPANASFTSGFQYTFCILKKKKNPLDFNLIGDKQ